MIISHTYRFIFVHIPKTGGESVTNAFAPHLARGDIVAGVSSFGALRNTYYRKRFGIKKHTSANQARVRLGGVWEEYFKFTFVRHPYYRARSLYFFLQKVDSRRRKWAIRNLQYLLPYVRDRDPLRWPALRAYTETNTFSEFIRHPSFSQDRAGSRSQFAMLSDPEGNILIDRVGRFESIAEDFGEIASTLGLPEAKLGWQNISKNSLGGEADLSKDDRDLLYKFYEIDFEKFGYEK